MCASHTTPGLGISEHTLAITSLRLPRDIGFVVMLSLAVLVFRLTGWLSLPILTACLLIETLTRKSKFGAILRKSSPLQPSQALKERLSRSLTLLIFLALIASASITRAISRMCAKVQKRWIPATFQCSLTSSSPIGMLFEPLMLASGNFPVATPIVWRAKATGTISGKSSAITSRWFQRAALEMKRESTTRHFLRRRLSL